MNPFIKLADGSTYIGDIELGNSLDFLFTEFRIQDVQWVGFDAETGLMGTPR